MPLTLEYPDKYRLWTALVRGNADRLFISTDARLRLGDHIPVEIRLSEETLPLVVHGTIVGRRGESRRFPRGVYVHVPEKELEKFRKFLRLAPVKELYGRARRSLRVHHDFPVRFIEPKLDVDCRTKNISETGLFVTCPAAVAPGQRVSLYVVLDEVPLLVEAEVAWASQEQAVAGLDITSISDLAAKRLREAIDTVSSEGAGSNGKAPILVADDDPDIVKFITRALSANGYEVFHAGSGSETMGMIRQLHPDLVVLDILMAGQDGAEICKAMRADAELADIHVIFVSALGEDVLHSVADESGATDYLPKPMRMRDLLEMVEYYLNPDRY